MSEDLNASFAEFSAGVVVRPSAPVSSPVQREDLNAEFALFLATQGSPFGAQGKTAVAAPVGVRAAQAIKGRPPVGVSGEEVGTV